MSKLVFRRAGPADAAAVSALAVRAYAKWVPLIGRKPRPMVADYDMMLRDHRIDLHEIDGNGLIASIATRIEPDCLFIETIAVDPAFQGQGLGKALLAHAEDLAREAKRREARLLTNALMKANAALYESIGYEMTHTEPHPVYGGVLHFRKLLG